MSTQKHRESLTRTNRWWFATPALLVPFLFMGAEREAEPVAAVVPAVTLEALGTRLPLHENARVERWMERFQTTQRAEFETLLKRRSAYDELVRGKLRQRGMPEQLLYLAMMESGFEPLAVSKVYAVGLWQFMSPTALQYGLRVDEWVDERRDPVRATDAALDYLHWLHGRFGSWYLAAAIDVDRLDPHRRAPAGGEHELGAAGAQARRHRQRRFVRGRRLLGRLLLRIIGCRAGTRDPGRLVDLVPQIAGG